MTKCVISVLKTQSRKLAPIGALLQSVNPIQREMRHVIGLHFRQLSNVLLMHYYTNICHTQKRTIISSIAEDSYIAKFTFFMNYQIYQLSIFQWKQF